MTAPTMTFEIQVLLVEDDPGDALLIEELLALEVEAFHVTRVGRLVDGIEALHNGDFDVVLLDLSLPDSIGLDTFDRIRTVAHDTPVVVVTGFDDQTTALRAVHAGAQDYLAKSRLDADALIRSVRYAVERKASERALEYQALHDPLTGLPNRTLFMDRLDLALAHADRLHLPTAVLFVDLDRFKLVNDTHGHDVGDALLVEVARRMAQVLRPGDTLARMGGDEFTVLCEGLDDDFDAASIASRLQAVLVPPVALPHGEERVTASIGATVARPGDTASSLLRDADIAMYRAKQNGRNRVEMFDADVRARLLRQVDLERALRTALDDDRLILHYQPVVDVVTGELVGAEALLRWRHPTDGLLTAADFIGVAEESGLIVPIGRWVLRTAFAQAAAWRRQMGTDQPFVVAVNVSGRQFSQPDFVPIVLDALRETGVRPDDVCLEITESILMDQVASGTMQELRALGISLAVDDFGTGYSSLLYLRRFPISVLKVDRSFVTRFPNDTEDATIVAAVIGLAHALGQRVVAEGVENQSQLAPLEKISCDFAQGYGLGMAATPEEIGARLPLPPELDRRCG